MIWLGEFPEPTGLAGIALIVAGSYFLVDRDPRRPAENAFVRFFRDRGIQYRFAALILSALEAVVLKRVLLDSSPLAAFAFWSLFGFGLSLVVMSLLFGKGWLTHNLSVLRLNRSSYVMLFATTGLMQFCTIITLGGFQVGYALALFQTSTLISVVLGWRFFSERHIARRLVGSAVMIGGAILIALSMQ